MSVVKKSKDTFEIHATTYGGKYWNSRNSQGTILVTVVERDSLAGDLDQEIRKLQETSRRWSVNTTAKDFVSSYTIIRTSHTDINARIRCAFVVFFFILVYVFGIIMRELVAKEHDAFEARASAPRNILSYVANTILTLVGYFLPYVSCLSITSLLSLPLSLSL